MIELITESLYALTGAEFWTLLVAIVVLPRFILLLLQGREASDQWQHMLYANEFRGAALTDLGRELTRFTPKAVFNYPPALQFLLERLGEEFFRKYVVIVNVALLCLEAVVVVYVWWSMDPLPRPALVISALCWGMFPFYMMPISGALSVSGRLPGALLSNLYFLTACSALPIAVKCFLATPIIIFAVFISKFSIQSIFIISLLSTAYSLNVDFIFMLIPATAVALSWKASRKILIGSFSHTIFYAKILQYIHVATVLRNKSVLSVLSSGSGIGLKELLQSIYHVPVIRVFFYFPSLFFVFLYLNSNLSEEWVDEYNSIEAVLASSIISAFLFSVRHLKFLGEADRYATFTSVLTAFSCLPLLVTTEPGYGIVLLTITLATWIALVAALKQKTNSSSNSGVDYKLQSDSGDNGLLIASVERTLADVASETDQEPYLMAVPQNLCEKVAVFFPDHRIIGLSGNQVVSAETSDYTRVLYENSWYPYPVNVQEYADLLKHPILMIIERQYLEPEYLRRSGLSELVSGYYDSLDATNISHQYSLVKIHPNNHSNV